jgi:predicted dehydrogenase
MAGGSVRLRVAVAGAGFASGLHLAGWRRLAHVDVVAICDPDESKARARAREFGIDRVFHSAEEMLDVTRPSALDVVSPMHTHVGLCMLAAERGIDVVCQKPLAPTLAEAQALARAVDGRIRLMVHENWRFRAHYRRIKQWLDEGAVGKVGSCTMQVRSSGLVANEDGALPALVRQPFCADLARFMINETLIHHLDVLRWLLGPLAVATSRIGFGCSAIRGEDRAMILLDGERCWAMLDGNMSVPGATTSVEDRLEITGDEGALAFTRSEVVVSGKRSARVRFDLAAGYADSYAAALRHFAECVASGAPFETDVTDNLHTLALVEDAYARAQVQH